MRLDSEGDDRSTYLNGFGQLRLQVDLAIGQHKGAELGQVVLQIEPTRLLIELDESMAPGHRDV